MRFFDLLPAVLALSVGGSGRVRRQLRAIAEGDSVGLHAAGACHGDRLPDGARGDAARRPARSSLVALWMCEVRDGCITEVVGYCNGGWDDELRARHAAEAPMLRPYGEAAMSTVDGCRDDCHRRLAAVEPLAPTIAGRASRDRGGRRLPADLLDELKAAGVPSGVLAPPSHGGLGADLPAALRLFEALAAPTLRWPGP